MNARDRAYILIGVVLIILASWLVSGCERPDSGTEPPPASTNGGANSVSPASQSFALQFMQIPFASVTTECHSDGSAQSVQSCHDSITDGDTITLPSGTFTWSTPVNISKAIKIQGDGRQSTIIQNAYNNGCTGNNGCTPLIKFQLGAGQMEVADIRFNNVATGNSSAIGIRTETAITPKLVIRDCWFDAGAGGRSAIFAATNQLLIYNSSFYRDTWGEGGVIQVKWEDATGRAHWNTDSTMGMADIGGATNMYIEDCDFHICHAIDMDGGARVVFRHNTPEFCHVNSHGADTAPVGMRHAEVYDNTFTFYVYPTCSETPDVQQNIWLRGGTAVITDNVLPRIASQCHGTKSNIKFSVLNTRRRSGPYCCWTQYPAPHQVGQGYGLGAIFHSYQGQCGYSGDYSYYTFAEPIYIWNNTGTAGNSVSIVQDATDECGNVQQVSDWIREGRDYIVGAKPGYQKFTYPHPLRGGNPGPSPEPTSTSSATASPLPTATPTSTPFPTQTPTASPNATATPTSTPISSPTSTPSETPTPVPFVLSANIYKWRGRYQADLSWYGSNAAQMDIYRNGLFLIRVNNTGFYSDSLGKTRTAVYRVCESDTNTCSNYAP